MESGGIGKSGVGTGLVDGASDITRLRPIWQAEQIESQTQGGATMPFPEWLKANGGNTGALPR